MKKLKSLFDGFSKAMFFLKVCLSLEVFDILRCPIFLNTISVNSRRIMLTAINIFL